MRKTTVGATTVTAALIASLALVSGGTATATTASGQTAAHSTTSGKGLNQTSLPVAVDPAADLTANPDRVNESWYVTAHVTAGGHHYGFLAHYLSAGDAKQGRASSAVSITDEDTGWYTRSEAILPARAGLSDKQGVDIHTDNISWTGDIKEQKLHAKVPEGTIDVTFLPQGNVLYNMGTGYFPMFGDAKYPNYEYALPTMATSGTLTLNGRTDKVRGESWLDRQWGPLPDIAAGEASWGWMNLNLSNGDKVSLWKTEDSKENSWATVLKPDGTQTVAEATLTPDNSTLWTSPTTGKKYPTRWKVTIPGEHAKLNVKTYTNDQELVITGPRYEGGAAVTGTYDHRPVKGTTYIEVAPSK
ncbi:lipocalin family protein [Streptomyces sp. N50]|uniref:lipocalin family protein n=1 Tax=Streptomyces sp. N50 TaxID=3081765 RepID=UPI0029620729|nr:lipocalin family protein [Streptomyces sp. N50]WOX15406.1 lipocalin family protein [Streptomyces sp. N50]